MTSFNESISDRQQSFHQQLKLAILQDTEVSNSTASVVKALRDQGIKLITPTERDCFPESAQGTQEAIQRGATDLLWINRELDEQHPVAVLARQTLTDAVKVWGVDFRSQKSIENDASIHGWLGSETLYEPIRRLSFESDGETVVDTEDEKSASSGEILTTHVLLKEPSNPIKETISQQLAREVCSLSYEDLSGECISNAKTLILDTVGCALAGSNEPVVETILRTSGFSNKGDTPLFGRSETLDPLSAALINGVSAHSLDFDDCHQLMGGHPSCPILPGLFSLASTFKCSGKDFILAFVKGFEVETKLAKVVNFYLYNKGFHPTSVLGIFGATAACCSLLNLTKEETAMALGLAVSMSSGVKANFGSMTKSLHIGECAKNGLSAALLAQSGFTSSLQAFEGKQGFFNVFNGEGNYDLSVFDDMSPSTLDIVETGPGIKLYPCCDSTHCSIDAVLSLKELFQFEAPDIKSIRIGMNPIRLTHVNKPVLKATLDAKFSVQFVTCRAIMDGGIGLSSFETCKYQNEEVLALMDKVHAFPHPDLSRNQEGNYLTHLQVELNDGRIFEKEMFRPFGRSKTEPAPHSSIKSKFFNCGLNSSLSQEKVQKLYQQSMDFENLESLDSFLENFSI